MAEVIWDAIDCHHCRTLAWKRASFRDDDSRILHLRRMGPSFPSVYHGRLRWGRGHYFIGMHPLYLAALSAYRMLERPWIVAGLLIAAGYMHAWASHSQRYRDMPFRQFLHAWQLPQFRTPRRWFEHTPAEPPTAVKVS